MKKTRPPILTTEGRTALCEAVAVLVSSAGLLARHIDRLPREKRDAQLAALNAAAAEVQRGVELLLEAAPSTHCPEPRHGRQRNPHAPNGAGGKCCRQQIACGW